MTMTYDPGADDLTKKEIEALRDSARESVAYHEESIIWVDAIAAQVTAEVAPYEGGVADAATALTQSSGSSSDRPRALQALAIATADLQIMTDAAARSKAAALAVHPRLSEAQARLAEYETKLREF